MPSLVACDSPIDLEDLAKRIRSSSNFRLAWQAYEYDDLDPSSPQSIRSALEAIIAIPALHGFLRDSFKPLYEPSFRIGPPHEHAFVAPAADQFEDILAAAAGDHLGAYSETLRPAAEHERAEVRRRFAQAGSYLAYELRPGEQPGCRGCEYYRNHVFTNWFYEVAWDWCLLTAWPQRRVLWMGCLTDTD